MLTHIYRLYAMGGRIQTVLLAINLPSFHTMRILRFFGCFSDFLCPSTFIVLPSTLCKHILLVFVECFDNILRIDGRVVIIVLVLEQLSVLSIHDGNKGIVQFGGGPIVILGTFRNDVEDS